MVRHIRYAAGGFDPDDPDGNRLSTLPAGLPDTDPPADGGPLPTDITDYGASTAGSSETNRAAIQAAIDDLLPAGGRLWVPDGTFDVMGIIQKSHVHIDGTGTLRHPDGTTDTAVVAAYLEDVTGTISSGSTTLTVSDTSPIEVGCVVAVRGAGVETEVADARLYAVVEGISGSDVTLSAAASRSVTDAVVTVGAVDMSISGIEIDGNRIEGGADAANPFPVLWRLARNSTIRNVTIYGGDHGAVMLSRGARDCNIEDCHLYDCGDPADQLGSVVWLFQGASSNTVARNVILGDCYHGVFVDDRTVTATEWDASCDENTVDNNLVWLDRYSGNVGVAVVGSDDNTISHNVVFGPATGYLCDDSGQGSAPLDATGNLFLSNFADEVSTTFDVTAGNTVQ